MTDAITAADASLTDALHRIARVRLSRARVACAAATPETRAQAVHAIRKQIKELRGLTRLVRPGLAEFDRINAALRDLAGSLAAARDARVRVDTLVRIEAMLDGAPADLAPYRATLQAACAQAHGDAHGGRLLAETAGALAALEADAAGWRLTMADRAVVAGGLARTYRRARRAMDRAARTRTPEAFHDWRKRVKYHGCHAGLLREINPDRIDRHIAAVAALGELLGTHHDLAVLRRDAGASGLAEPVRKRIDAAAARQMAGLEKTILRRAAPLFATRPGVLEKRWMRWWDSARG